MTKPPERAAAAASLKEEMLLAGQTEREFDSLAKLVSAFGFMIPTEDALHIVDAALAWAGLSTQPPLTSFSPRETGKVKVRRALGRVTDPAVRKALAQQVKLTIWRPGAHRPTQIAGELVADSDPAVLRSQLTWFHIDLRGGDHISAADLFDFLAERCPGITRPVVDDILDPDTESRVRRFGDALESRVVSIPEIVVEPHPDRIAPLDLSIPPDMRSKTGLLRRRMTEIAAGNSWALTAWHEPTWHGRGAMEHAYRWAEEHGPDPQYPDVVDRVSRRWEVVDDDARGHVLALLVLLVVANDHSVARRAMYSWLDEWDRGFYEHDAAVRQGRDSTTASIERATLLDLQLLVTMFRKDVVALNSPQSAIENAWFAGRPEDAHQFSALVETTIGDLRDLSDSIRMSFDLLATNGMEQSLVLARRQEEATSRLNDLVQWVGFFLLGPSLLATLLAVPDNAFEATHLLRAALAFSLGVVLTATTVFLLSPQRRRRELLVRLRQRALPGKDEG